MIATDRLTRLCAAKVRYVVGRYARLARAARWIDADDLRQEAEIKVWLAVRSEPEGKPWPANYIVAAARSACVNALRRTWPRDKPTAKIASLVSDPADGRSADSADAAIDVRNAVASLTPEQRGAVLDWLDGMTYAESAARLGIGLGGVQSRRLRAFAALRTTLAAYDPTEDH